jgi:ribosomal protein S18 acetylase RimI-like enzyme
MTSESKVRDATAGDAEEIYALAREMAEIVGDRYPELEAVRGRLEELLEEPRARVLVAEGEGEVIGVVSLWIKPDLAHGDTVVEVPMLAVAEGSRRRGVGRLLMDEVRKLAVADEASLMELVATSANEPAREFYRSLGFVEADLVAFEFVGDLHSPPER